jgi:hypothetical protein
MSWWLIPRQSPNSTAPMNMTMGTNSRPSNTTGRRPACARLAIRKPSAAIISSSPGESRSGIELN